MSAYKTICYNKLLEIAHEAGVHSESGLALLEWGYEVGYNCRKSESKGYLSKEEFLHHLGTLDTQSTEKTRLKLV